MMIVPETARNVRFHSDALKHQSTETETRQSRQGSCAKRAFDQEERSIKEANLLSMTISLTSSRTIICTRMSSSKFPMITTEVSLSVIRANFIDLKQHREYCEVLRCFVSRRCETKCPEQARTITWVRRRSQHLSNHRKATKIPDTMKRHREYCTVTTATSLQRTSLARN